MDFRPGANFAQISWLIVLERLLKFMQPHQRLMAVPETWVRNEFLDHTDWPDILLSRFRQHLEIAVNEPRFIAFIPFIWSFNSPIELRVIGS